jgi:hypothetical protein
MDIGTVAPCHTPGSDVAPSYFDVCNVSHMLDIWTAPLSRGGHEQFLFVVEFQLHILCP